MMDNSLDFSRDPSSVVSLVTHLSRRLLATMLVAAGIAVFLLAPRPAQAETWSNVWGNCGGGGIACALDDWDRRWSDDPHNVLLFCYYSYDDFGRIAGAGCAGTNGGNFRGGNAGLSCDGTETKTSEGCKLTPLPAYDLSCPNTTKKPVDMRAGMTVERRTDFTTDGPSPLTFERFYASSTAHVIGLFTPSRLGRGWRSSFDSSLSVMRNWVGIVLPSGEIFLFDLQAGQYLQAYWSWTSGWVEDGIQGRVASLTQDPTSLAFTLTVPDDHMKWTYDQTGKLQTIDYQNGYTQSLTYDTNGNNSVVTDSLGRTLQFSYSAQGLLNSMTVPGSQTYQYSYLAQFPSMTPAPDSTQMPSEFFALQTVTQPDTTTIQYLYENTSFPFALTGITNEAGVRFATWAYGSDGRVSSEQRAGGVDNYTYSYNDTAHTATVTNPLSKNTVYHYTLDLRSNNLLTQLEGQASTNCVASNSYTAHDSNNFVTDETDAEGRVTHYVRDSAGNPTSITRAYGTASAQTNTYTWDSTRGLLTESVEPGLTTDYTWNTTGQLTQLKQTDTTTQTTPYSTAGQTRIWTYAYSGALLTSVDGPLSGTGDTVSYTYNSSGYVASVTNEVGQATTITAWNSRGQPTSLTDANSVVSSLGYDTLGHLTSVMVDPSGLAATTTIAYNAVGDVTQITRPNGAFLAYTYDNARRLTKVQDNSGAFISYTLDNMGNATARSITDAGSTVRLSQTAVFDELGRLLKFVGASSQTWKSGYDRTDNRVSVTDPRSNVFGWTFDALNRLIKTTDEESNVVTLTRNGKDEITNYSDPRSLSTGFVRNGFGEVIQRSSPDTGTTVYTYNALGKPTQIKDGRSIITNLTYDNAGRLLSKQYPASTGENITYTWDATASGNKGKGRVTKIQDASGAIEFTYNSLGQVTQEKKTTGTVVYSIGYAYDKDGNVTQITYPSGRTVSYSRGATGLVTGVTTKATSTATSVTLASGVAYQPFGSLQTLTYGNSLVLTKTFNQDSNLTALTIAQGTTSIINRGYGYSNGDFDITNILDNNVTGRTDYYVYTPNHWLQNAYGNWGEATYWQDGVGNRTGDIFNNGTMSGGTYVNGPTTTTKTLNYPYNSNIYTGTTQGSTTLRATTSDGAGNITTDVQGSTTYKYRYNNRGRLDQLTIGTTVTASYSYDGLERMSVRTTQNMTPSATTHYLYDRAGRLLVEASATGTTQTEYVWIDDMPVAMFANLDTASPKQWYVHPDQLNRPSRMTDATKAVVWDAWYWPYGQVRSITGTATNNLRFPGQYFLIESGLQYNWHRHYDPTIGRYIQADPIRDAIATMPVGLEGGGLTAGTLEQTRTDKLGDWSIGAELPEFGDGPSVYAYGRSAPSLDTDPNGQQAQIILRGATFCAKNPTLCASTIAAAVKACIDTFKRVGHNDNTPPYMCKPLAPTVTLTNGNKLCQYLCPDGTTRSVEIMATFACPKMHAP